MGKVTLVLGGGGLRGLAHIGALKAIRALHIPVHEYIGTSMGSLICALAAGGMEVEEMERHATELKSDNILDFSLSHFIRKTLWASSLYRGERLRRYIRNLIPIDSFKLLETPLLVNSVKLETGEEVYWGSEGRDDIPVHEAVYASCALPGIFPPLERDDSCYVDGGIISNLPVRMALRRKADLIIALNLGLPVLRPLRERTGPKTILNMLMQGSGLMMRRILQLQLREFIEYPLILIEPQFSDQRLFDFEETEHSIRAGERAALNILRDHPLLTLIE
jgi:NTE family protein